MLLKLFKRKKFYENVKFASKESKKFLYEAIYNFAKQNGLEKFEYITNYVSHATISKYKESGWMFDVKYPITIDGESMMKIHIKDSEDRLFDIALDGNKIIYYEMSEGKAICYVAICNPKVKKKFYKKVVHYRIE